MGEHGGVNQWPGSGLGGQAGGSEGTQAIRDIMGMLKKFRIRETLNL